MHRLPVVLTSCGLTPLNVVHSGRTTNGRKPHARFVIMVTGAPSTWFLGNRPRVPKNRATKFLLVRTACYVQACSRNDVKNGVTMSISTSVC